jgi:hypothetical protein
VSYPGIQDWLIYAGIPLAVIAIIFALVYASGSRSAKRYRPGRPYEFAPVWFLARPEADGPAAADHNTHKITSGAHVAEIGSGTVDGAAAAAIVAPKSAGHTGGASDRW